MVHSNCLILAVFAHRLRWSAILAYRTESFVSEKEEHLPGRVEEGEELVTRVRRVPVPELPYCLLFSSCGCLLLVLDVWPVAEFSAEDKDILYVSESLMD